MRMHRGKPLLAAASALFVGALMAFQVSAGQRSAGSLSSEQDSTSPAAQPAAAWQPPSANALACYETAVDETPLEDALARQLCQGSQDSLPVTCYDASEDRTALSDAQSVELCICARSTAPVDCFERAVEETELSDAEIITLCSARALHKVAAPHCT